MGSTLVIYDTSGFIISQMQGSALQEPTGVPFLWVNIPEGKRLVSINVSVTPNEPVFEDLPKTEVQIMQSNMLSIEDALFTAFSQLDTMNGGV
jgi:hypothetical protein